MDATLTKTVKSPAKKSQAAKEARARPGLTGAAGRASAPSPARQNKTGQAGKTGQVRTKTARQQQKKSEQPSPSRSPWNEAPREIGALARAHAAAAVAALVAVMQDETASHAARVSAAGALLQWGFGKADAATRAKLLRDLKAKSPVAEQVVRLRWAMPKER